MPLQTVGVMTPGKYRVTDVFTGQLVGIYTPTDKINITVNLTGVYLGVAELVEKYNVN